MNENPRKIAVKILVDVIENGQSLSEKIKSISDKDNRAVIQEYCFGVCRWYFQCEHFLNQLLKKPIKEKNIEVKILLLLAIYELTHMTTAEHAVVNESVKTVVSLKHPFAKNLVNGVLRNFIRKKNELDNDTISHPKWLVKKLQNDWPDDWEKIVEVNNEYPPMILRTKNEAKEYVDEYWIPAFAGMTGEGARMTEGIPGYPNAIRLTKPCPVTKLPGFESGEVSVQDCSAQLAAPLLRLKPGLRVLDACAAPGGKTCHILELESDLKELIALDIDEQRLALVKDNLNRCGLTATLITGDATRPKNWWDGEKFDRILLDAPCSASGVIRRNPDIKLHRRPDDIPLLAAHQIELLTALWPLLNDGGYLLYATCSIFKEENELVIKKFLAEQPDAKIVEELQLLPDPEKGDGFYYCLLAR